MGIMKNKYFKQKAHGYWETDLNKRHFFNAKKVGLCLYENISGIFSWGHYFNEEKIGCHFNNDFKINNYTDGPKIEKYKVQEFYNKNNKKFGEEIEWK